MDKLLLGMIVESVFLVILFAASFPLYNLLSRRPLFERSRSLLWAVSTVSMLFLSLVLSVAFGARHISFFQADFLVNSIVSANVIAVLCFLLSYMLFGWILGVQRTPH